MVSIASFSMLLVALAAAFSLSGCVSTQSERRVISQPAPVPLPPTQVFIYPNSAQIQAQQERDRYECHRWAVGETGFDPSNLDTGIGPSELVEKRANYQRATKACLEAREYSVR